MTVDKQIFWLQIPVDNIQVVKVLESQHDLSCVKSGVGLTEKRQKTCYLLKISQQIIDSENKETCNSEKVTKSLRVNVLLHIVKTSLYLYCILFLMHKGQRDYMQTRGIYYLLVIIKILQFDRIINNQRTFAFKNFSRIKKKTINT